MNQYEWLPRILDHPARYDDPYCKDNGMKNERISKEVKVYLENGEVFIGGLYCLAKKYGFYLDAASKAINKKGWYKPRSGVVKKIEIVID